MKLKTFRHLWGITDPFEQVFPLIKSEGYDGIEYKGAVAAANPIFKSLLDEYGFKFIAQVHTIGETVKDHIESFKQIIQASLTLNPILFNSQSGKDSWTVAQKHEFITAALAFEQEIGIPVAHEIH